MGQASLPFASARRAAVAQICAALEAAIAEARECEARRRVATLDRRMAQEAYRRARAATQRALLEFYGGMIAGEFAELFI
jgi:hypothetical protein